MQRHKSRTQTQTHSHNQHHTQQKQVERSPPQVARQLSAQQQQEFNKMREKLFRLHSKVPIKDDTQAKECSLASKPSNAAASSTASNAQAASNEALIIKYYSDRSLHELIDCHFRASLAACAPPAPAPEPDAAPASSTCWPPASDHSDMMLAPPPPAMSQMPVPVPTTEASAVLYSTAASCSESPFLVDCVAAASGYQPQSQQPTDCSLCPSGACLNAAYFNQDASLQQPPQAQAQACGYQQGELQWRKQPALTSSGVHSAWLAANGEASAASKAALGQCSGTCYNLESTLNGARQACDSSLQAPATAAGKLATGRSSRLRRAASVAGRSCKDSSLQTPEPPFAADAPVACYQPEFGGGGAQIQPGAGFVLAQSGAQPFVSDPFLVDGAMFAAEQATYDDYWPHTAPQPIDYQSQQPAPPQHQPQHQHQHLHPHQHQQPPHYSLAVSGSPHKLNPPHCLGVCSWQAAPELN